MPAWSAASIRFRSTAAERAPLRGGVRRYVSAPSIRALHVVGRSLLAGGATSPSRHDDAPATGSDYCREYRTDRGCARSLQPSLRASYCGERADRRTCRTQSRFDHRHHRRCGCGVCASTPHRGRTVAHPQAVSPYRIRLWAEQDDEAPVLLDDGIPTTNPAFLWTGTVASNGATNIYVVVIDPLGRESSPTVKAVAS